MVNTVLCGGDDETARVWTEIATQGRGKYAPIMNALHQFHKVVYEAIREQAAGKGIDYE